MHFSFAMQTLALITTLALMVGCATERSFDIPSETIIDTIGALYDPERQPKDSSPPWKRYEVIRSAKKTGPSIIINYSEYRKMLIAKTEIKVTPTGEESTFVRIISKSPQGILDLFFGPSRDARYERKRLAEIESKLGVEPLASKQ